MIFNRYKIMYGRFISPKFLVGTTAALKFESHIGTNSNRKFDSSPAWGGMPSFGQNKYNAYEKIWGMPYSSGYNIGAFVRYNIFRNGPYVHGEFFGQQVSYDHVNVVWSKHEAAEDYKDSARASAATAGFKLLLGATNLVKLSEGLGLFVDYFMGCSAQVNYVDIFHYKTSEPTYNHTQGSPLYNVTKLNEGEKFSYLSFLPELGIRVGLRF